MYSFQLQTSVFPSEVRIAYADGVMIGGAYLTERLDWLMYVYTFITAIIEHRVSTITLQCTIIIVVEEGQRTSGIEHRLFFTQCCWC